MNHAILCSGSRDQTVVGLPVQTRNRLVAERAGCRVITEGQCADLAPNEQVVVVPATTVIQPSLFRRLPAEIDQPVWWTGPDSEAGVLVLTVDALRQGGVALHRAADAPTFDVGPDALFDTSTAQARRRTTKRLLRLTQKPTDGIVSRNLNRPISRVFSRLFLALGMSANHASAISLLIGVAAAIFCAMTGAWTLVVAGLLFQFASIFDGVDGEMARVTLSESRFGAWLDTAIDNLTYVLCLAGIIVGWLREGPGPLGVALGVALLVAVPATLAVLFRFVHRHGPDGSLVFIDRVVAQARDDTPTTSLRVARVLFYGLRRDVFALALCAVCMFGVRAAIPAVVLGGLTVALTVFMTHRAALVAAAEKLGRAVRA